MTLIIPKKYKQKLLPETTEVAIKKIKDTFQTKLAAALNLRRVTAPLFVLSGTGINEFVRSKKYDYSWNFGFGVEFINHLQIGAGYGLGLTKTSTPDAEPEYKDIQGKNRYWTVTAAWLF